jgi:hypothetical protein
MTTERSRPIQSERSVWRDALQSSPHKRTKPIRPCGNQGASLQLPAVTGLRGPGDPGGLLCQAARCPPAPVVATRACSAVGGEPLPGRPKGSAHATNSLHEPTTAGRTRTSDAWTPDVRRPDTATPLTGHATTDTWTSDTLDIGHVGHRTRGHRTGRPAAWEVVGHPPPHHTRMTRWDTATSGCGACELATK